MNHSLPDLKDLTNSIEEFNRCYPRPGMAPIKLEEYLFDLKEDYNALFNEFAGKIGIYIIMTETEEIIRIGSATEDMYARLNNYFDYADSRQVCGLGWWKESVGARFIRHILIPRSRVFEVLAVEKYLLDRLTPPLNKEGKSKFLWYRINAVEELNRLADVYGWEKVNKSWYSCGQ